MATEAPIPIRLAWTDPESQLRKEEVVTLPLTIGRQAGLEIQINHPQLSGKHATISGDSRQVVIQDEESTNGTFVNDRQVTRAALQNGDVIRLGSQTVQIAIAPLAGPATVSVDIKQHDGATQRQTAELPLTIGRDPASSIVVDDPAVSRTQATLQNNGGTLELIHHSDSQPTRVNGQPISRVVLRPGLGDVIEVGSTELRIFPADPSSAPPPPAVKPSNKTIIFSPDDDSVRPAAQVNLSSHEFPPAWFKESEIVPINQIRNSSYAVDETVYLAVGGGLGSFIWVDNLLVYGVPRNHILSIGFEPKPYGRYRRLCSNSQIPGRERLRSNSDSTPDNIWGWPGYAVRESWTSFWKGDIKNAFRVAWQIFGEPTFAETYTPISQNVFDSIDREAERISWAEIWRRGSVRAIRKTDDGRYAVAYVQKSADRQRSIYKFAVAQHLHLAVGYPGIRLLPNLQEYRQRTGDFKKIVNAYEEHNHVYQQLERKGGVVVVRGRGIVASRIIQRLYETRQSGAKIQVVHLMRSPVPEGNRYGSAQREVDNHWEFQPFNWPKAAWSGDLRVLLENAAPAERKRLIGREVWGGTTTADRTDWKEIVNDGLAEGWYQIKFATIARADIDPSDDCIKLTLDEKNIDAQTAIAADFVVDATGLESGIEDHPLLKDMLDTYRLTQNVQDRLEVSNDFELLDMRHGDARMYAAGVITLGGPYVPVDSFLGLQYSAQRSVEHLASEKAPAIRPMNMFRSYAQWIRWVQGVAP